MPGLLLALATSVIAYLMLGLAPFPGLRQMALFSATGLVAAFLTVACWFPLLDRGLVPSSRFANAISNSLARWPRFRATRRSAALGVVLALLAAVGLARLEPDDDVRQLQSSPPALLQSQREVQRLLQLPSPAQFLWVAGATTEDVLQREERLKPLLDAQVAAGALKGYLALSDWVPSLARQQADAALTARVETQVLAQVGRALGEDLQRPRFDAAALTPQGLLARPESAALRGLWLDDAGRGPGSVVLLQGLVDAAQAASVRAAVQGVEGVRWVDRVAEISTLMARYRGAMSLLLLLGHGAVLLALCWHFGRTAWRAWLPTAIAALFTLAMLGWLGEPLQLFNVLALILLLGIGVDYGIFLLEHDGEGSAWLAVVLGGASTLLSFGLLGLSGTPALRAFGLTMALGTTCVWLLSPLFRRSPSAKPAH
jgi:predicted exporter